MKEKKMNYNIKVDILCKVYLLSYTYISEEAIKKIERARRKIKKGQFLSEVETRKRLGLNVCN